EITPADGNIFADLGLPDAEELRHKTDLLVAIIRILRERRLTQTKAAKVAGITQPEVSNLLHGKLEGFSIERMIRILAALGYEVRVQVAPAERLQRREAKAAAEVAA